MKKRFFFIVLCLIAILLVFCSCSDKNDTTEPVEEANPASDFEYESDSNGGIIITKYIGTDDTVVVPEEIDGYSVTQIGHECFAYNTKISTVELPDSVTYIGVFAFSGCSSMTQNILSQKTERIDIGAFLDCTSLKEIILPDTLTTMGDMAFQNCSSLSSIIIPERLTHIPDRAFENAGLENVEIRNGIKYISTNAFSKTKISKVILPESVQFISNYAFFACPELKSVTLNEGLETIGQYVFSESHKLENIVVPKSVKNVDEATFFNCNSLKKVMFEGDAPEEYLVKFDAKGNYTICYHENAEGFSSPEWNGYKTEIW